MPAEFKRGWAEKRITGVQEDGSPNRGCEEDYASLGDYGGAFLDVLVVVVQLCDGDFYQ